MKVFERKPKTEGARKRDNANRVDQRNTHTLLPWVMREKKTD